MSPMVSAPIWPAPEMMLLLLVKTLLELAPTMRLFALFDSVTAPAPNRLMSPEQTRSVVLPDELSLMVPALKYVPAAPPRKTSLVPLAMLTPPPAGLEKTFATVLVPLTVLRVPVALLLNEPLTKSPELSSATPAPVTLKVPPFTVAE